LGIDFQDTEALNKVYSKLFDTEEKKEKKKKKIKGKKPQSTK